MNPMIPEKIFSHENKYEVAMFMVAWEGFNPTLPVKMMYDGTMWHCVPDRSKDSGAV